MQFTIAKIAVALVVVSITSSACNSKSSDPGTETLSLITDAQVNQLLAEAERLDGQGIVKQELKDEHGATVGVVSSGTQIVFLKPGGRLGGGRFGINTTCTAKCTGIPTILNPGGNNSCSGKQPTGCDPSGGTCSTCTCPDGCTPDCTTTKTGFGNFGIFIAQEDLPKKGFSVAFLP